MEGWVDLGYPAVHRPGTELAISRSLVRRPTTTLTEQPARLATHNAHASRTFITMKFMAMIYGMCVSGINSL